jgi:serine/threonine protein kinase
MAAAAAITPYVPVSPLGENVDDNIPVGTNYNLNNIGTDEHLETRTIGPYTMRLIVGNTNGHPRRIRKVATKNYRAGHHHATINEVQVYRDLLRKSDTGEYILPDVENNILPFYRAVRGDNWVYLNFKYVDGADFEKYLSALYPRNELTETEKESKLAETKRLLIAAAKHLKWLLQVGGYSHGDIKLNNFYRAKDGRTFVIDFGKARKNIDAVQISVDIRDFIKMMGKELGMTDISMRNLFEHLHKEADSYLRETGSSLQRQTSETTPVQREQIIKNNQNYNRQKGVIIYDKLITYLSTGMTGGSRRRTSRRRTSRQKTYSRSNYKQRRITRKH